MLNRFQQHVEGIYLPTPLVFSFTGLKSVNSNAALISSQLPRNLSWSNFVKLSENVDLVQALQVLDPTQIPEVRSLKFNM